MDARAWLNTSPIAHGPARRLGKVIAALMLACLVLAQRSVAGRDDPPGLPAPVQRRVDFIRDLKPLFDQRCASCHGATRQRGGLRLDRASTLLKGGDSGPVVLSGKSEESPLIRHVAALGDAARMPPKGEALTAAQIGLLRAWIDQGASIPAALLESERKADEAGRWALQPLHRPATPVTPAEYTSWVRTPIDAFILERLLANGMRPGPEVERRTLIRRLSIDLTGLPATPEETRAFVSDKAADAYEKLVDRLLASPRYGERWARHWLDVVHYADSHGQDQDRPRPNAWPYRDYVIRSLNADKPYARFVREQIAGDALYPGEPDALVATGFLAAGPWDESGLRDIREDSLDRQIARYLDRDDIVTSTMSTFAGMTVGCARCHDHKFDPITQEDYYSLQAVFAGIDKAERAYEADAAVGEQRARLTQEIERVRSLAGKAEPTFLTAERQKEVEAFETEWRAAGERWFVPEPLSWKSKHGAILKALLDRSILSIGNRPDRDVYSVALALDKQVVTGLRLELLADETLPHQGPGRQDNGNLHLSEIRVSAHPMGKPDLAEPIKIKNAFADFDQAGWGVARAIDGDPTTAWGIYPQVGKPHQAVFEFEKPINLDGGAVVTVELDQLHGDGHLLGRFRLALTTASPIRDADRPVPAQLVEALSVSAVERTAAQRVELARWLLEGQLQRALAALPPQARVYCGTNRFTPDGSFKPAAEPRLVNVLKRGEVTRPGKAAAPGAIAAVPSLVGRFALRDPRNESERRAALADWLTAVNNPLTWRVIVNRVWHYHFGKGIVDTPNDLGRMGGTPSHPELLDWLAVEFRDGGGSLKKLHRLIVTSSVYRQAIRFDPSYTAKDADNRLLWRMNRGRLDAETLRDAMLLLTDRLAEKMYGPPIMHFVMKKGVHVTPEANYDAFDVDGAEARRRSIYRYIFRTRPDPLLEALDCPDPSQSAPVRPASVGATQALVLWNNKFTLRQAEHLAKLAEMRGQDVPQQVEFVAQRLFTRTPNQDELEAWKVHVNRHGLANLCRVLLNSSEFLFIE